MNGRLDDQWLWVIGGGLLQLPLLDEAKALGLRVLISDLDPGCVCADRAERFLAIDVFDVDAHLAALERIASEDGILVSGVLAAGIDAPETMAAMNRRLGLRGVSVETARVTRQKDLLRARLRELGYPVPRFRVLRPDTHLDAAAAAVGFPLIVKPPANSASRDMRIFQSHEAPRLGDYIRPLFQRYDRLLLEQVWEGPEQTVECLVDIHGHFHRGFITDRKFTLEGGFPVETGLVHPTELTTEIQEQLYRLAEDLARDFRIEAGAVKLDTMLTTEGPRLVELAVRHSGGFDCQFLVPLSTGKNILRAAILTALQRPFDPALLTPRRPGYGVTGSVWPPPGRLRAIQGLDQARATPGVAHVFLRYNSGDVIHPYVDCARRAAFIIATGESRQAAARSLEQAQSALRLITV